MIKCKGCMYYGHPYDCPDPDFMDCLYDGDEFDDDGLVIDLPCDYSFGENDEKLSK